LERAGRALLFGGGVRPTRTGQRRLLDRPVACYGIAIGFIVGAAVAAYTIEVVTGRFLTFPFYAAVVAGAWLGVGPGRLAGILAIVAVEDFWTPPLFSLAIAPAELPAFIAFVVCTLAAFAW